ncbi:hypothetical protein AVEN_225068-1 [Araneus ventricosus]|uniref:Uncharacterized protein n=1 Tax=Araneus ventricosus TaxID=182803 RepID=A0A4Y2J9X7_ARAVE|nr:hypothetical protein AVEN_225068-1 [Araneus ventricosus]
MRQLAAEKISDDDLRLLGLQRLPMSTQQILPSSSEALQGLAKIGDKISEVSDALPSIDLVHTNSDDTISRLEARIEELLQTIRRFSFPGKKNTRRRANRNISPFWEGKSWIC